MTGAGTATVAVCAAYLLGTFPTALVVGRRTGHDPTREGSGNPGASNVYRTSGRAAGVTALVGDAAKGALAAGGGLLLDGRALGLACGAAAVVGHVVPLTRPTRGGKGVATTAGATLVLFPLVALALVVVFAAVARLSGAASMASLTVMVLLPVGVWLVGRPLPEILTMTGVAALVVARHHENIERLVRHEELGL